MLHAESKNPLRMDCAPSCHKTFKVNSENISYMISALVSDSITFRAFQKLFQYDYYGKRQQQFDELIINLPDFTLCAALV